MPAECRRRGVLRWKGIVKINGKQAASKWFGRGPKGDPEYKRALRWEDSTRASLPTDGEIPTLSVCWTVLDWANEYLAFAQERNSPGTFQEKLRAFKLLLQQLGPDGKGEDITIPVAMNHLRSVKKSTTGSAANASRKNLAKAWEWGRKYLEHFPLIVNPFRAVDKFPVKRKPRYVPPEEDFRKGWSCSRARTR